MLENNNLPKRQQIRNYTNLVKIPTPVEVQENSTKRVGSILNKIENNQQNFKNLISNYIKREPLQFHSQGNKSFGSKQQGQTLNQIEHKSMKIVEQKNAELPEKQEKQFNQPSNKSTPKQKLLPPKIHKVIQQINEREIKSIKKIHYQKKEPNSNKRKQQIIKQQESPIPKLKSKVNGRDQLKNHHEPDQSINQIQQLNESMTFRKSYLDFDLKNFKKNLNGTLVRISPVKIEQDIANRISQLKPRKNQTIYLNNNRIKYLGATMGNPGNTIYHENINSNDTRNSPSKKEYISLIDIQPQKIKNFIELKGYLDQESSANVIYQYFNNMIDHINVKFQSLLIKKYKNCIYFGENPSSGNKGFYQGILYHYNTKIYYGQFINNKKCGKGCQISFRDNVISKGTFDFGNKVGKFLIIKGDQYEYQGQLNNGLFFGKGILKSKYSRYEGTFKDGKKHGQGHQLFFLSGQTYVGEYFQGNFDGAGEISSKNYLYQGGFKQNLKQGEGYQKNQTQEYKGSFFRGKRQGKGVLHFQNGDIYIGEFKQGQMYGSGQYIYANKQIIAGYFINGRLISEQKRKPTIKPFTLSNKKSNDPKNPIQQSTQNYEDGPERFMLKAETKPQVFNHQKLLKLTHMHNQSFTDRTIFNTNPHKIQYQMGGIFNRRNSELDRSKFINQGQKLRYQSNERKPRSINNNDLMKHFSPNQFTPNQNNNTFMQLDYSLADNSVDEQLPTFPAIHNTRKRNPSGHADEPPIRKK